MLPISLLGVWIGQRIHVEVPERLFRQMVSGLLGAIGLLLLMRNEGLVLERGVMYERIWGYDFDGSSRSLDVHVGYLRRKLELYAEHEVEPFIGGQFLGTGIVDVPIRRRLCWRCDFPSGGFGGRRDRR